MDARDIYIDTVSYLLVCVFTFPVNYRNIQASLFPVLPELYSAESLQIFPRKQFPHDYAV